MGSVLYCRIHLLGYTQFHMAATSFPLTLRLDNISASCTTEHLRNLISQFGAIKSMETPLPALWMSFPVGRCEVVMEEESKAIEAFANLDGCTLDGSRMRARLVRIDPSKDAKKVLPPQPVVRDDRSRNDRRQLDDRDNRRGGKRDRSNSRRRSTSRTRRGRSYERNDRRNAKDTSAKSPQRSPSRSSPSESPARSSPPASPSESAASSPSRTSPE
eukprot:GILI01021607.1.p1 GENE.GILI01021607.1~~GILI01021607.1.p1  ORF type:complete len:216 (+),score=16.52 GILI01021607.1:1-648(+)